ncbi:hypothetical protein Bhyg_16762 [Pseudolycoriella hygida]|uniref:Uncharacterized protein n=1 Tax=Pseudolycoriella hygida TaxID=35572 RepID=A0A9Q0MLK9_9DIPT|nr:hypothetical protein Bhyg_16762 [Pseudolycoriella hygida]
MLAPFLALEMVLYGISKHYPGLQQLQMTMKGGAFDRQQIANDEAKVTENFKKLKILSNEKNRDQYRGQKPKRLRIK